MGSKIMLWQSTYFNNKDKVVSFEILFLAWSCMDINGGDNCGNLDTCFASLTDLQISAVPNLPDCLLQMEPVTAKSRLL